MTTLSESQAIQSTSTEVKTVCWCGGDLEAVPDKGNTFLNRTYYQTCKKCGKVVSCYTLTGG